MFAVKLLANLVLAGDCYIVLNMFEHVFTFPISLEVLIITDYCYKLLTFYMFMFNSSEPIRVTHLQKLANQSLLNGALVMEIVNNSFSESKKNFSRLIKRKRF